MAWKRKSRAELMAWMNGHPAAWEGFPKQGNTREHSGRIFAAMQADGLFAPRSNNAVSTIVGLVSRARFARRMEKVKPERN